VAALVLRNYNMRVAEQQAAIGMERSRIARDIHDGALQRIAHVMYKLEFIERMLEKQQSPHILSEVQQVATLLRESLQDLRHNISSLLPMQLEKQEFAIALQALLDEYKVSDQGVEIYCDFDDLRQVPTRLQGTIFRFVQEALNNVYKHARATRVSIGIHMLADWLSAEVSDNGVGFQAQRVMSRSGAGRNAVATVSHIGLHSMRGRVREAGGNLEVRSRPGEGTIVRVRFPLLNSDEVNGNSSL
jgi:signal transduction histidine kinase